jgi:SAM-dependent methyltransferase
MRLRDAIDMLADSGVDALGPTIWADLGCGDGTFTLALADVLASGSIIYAIDLDGSVLRRIPSAHEGVRIIKHRGDFMKWPWPFPDLDGVLMANSLHYVEKPAACIRECESHMKPQRRFLVVEYDTNEASRWIPYPLSQTRLTTLFDRAGYSSVRLLRSRPSVYRRAPLYAVDIGQL